MSESSKMTLGWPDRWGREQVRKINHVINIEDFKDKPGFAWLVIAANPHLSASDIQTFLELMGEQHWRSTSWIGRHRWLFQGNSKPGTKPNADGLDKRAYSIIRDYPRMSSRQLAHLMRERGVQRSAEWVRRHRSVATSSPIQ